MKSRASLRVDSAEYIAHATTSRPSEPLIAIRLPGELWAKLEMDGFDRMEVRVQSDVTLFLAPEDARRIAAELMLAAGKREEVAA